MVIQICSKCLYVIQEALAKLGYYLGEDETQHSSFSRGTEAAVKAWQVCHFSCFYRLRVRKEIFAGLLLQLLLKVLHFSWLWRETYYCVIMMLFSPVYFKLGFFLGSLMCCSFFWQVSVGEVDDGIMSAQLLAQLSKGEKPADVSDTKKPNAASSVSKVCVLSLFQWEMMNWSDTASSSYIVSASHMDDILEYYSQRPWSCWQTLMVAIAEGIWSPSWNTMSVHS